MKERRADARKEDWRAAEGNPEQENDPAAEAGRGRRNRRHAVRRDARQHALRVQPRG